jgi:non-ribosomal peptide synthetase component F
LINCLGCAIENNELIIVEEMSMQDTDTSSTDTTTISTTATDATSMSSISSLMFKRVPDGAKGELLVAGAHVAHGYHNNVEETNKRFLAWPRIKCDGQIVYYLSLLT